MSGVGGRVAIVTGASAGIGEAVARDLHAGGASVVINARRVARLESLASELGERVAIAPGDASEKGVVAGLFDAARSAFGRDADLVVVNAGRGLRGSLVDSNEDEWEEMFRTNITGAALLMREAAHRLKAGVPMPDAEPDAWRERPRDIVVLGSTVGRHISPFSSMYGGTKFAVNSWAEALRRELAPAGIRVTLIEPGVVRTEFQESAGYEMEGFGAFMDRVGPVLKAEDVSRCVIFAVGQPAHVHVNDMVVRPTRQEYP